LADVGDVTVTCDGEVPGGTKRDEVTTRVGWTR